jgi:hypothetical protein
MAGLRPLVETARGYQTAAFGEGFAPHLAAGEIVTLGVDGRERFEFVFRLGEPWDDAPTHHHQFTLSGLAASTNDRLGITGRNVVVRRDDADIVCGAAHVKMLGNLLLIEEAVVTTAHELRKLSLYLLNLFLRVS